MPHAIHIANATINVTLAPAPASKPAAPQADISDATLARIFDDVVTELENWKPKPPAADAPPPTPAFEGDIDGFKPTDRSVPTEAEKLAWLNRAADRSSAKSTALEDAWKRRMRAAPRDTLTTPFRIDNDGNILPEDAEGIVAVVIPATGLMWASDTLPDRKTWAEADAACKALTLFGHTDWRLPTREELVSLVDYTRHGPAINTDLFPNTKRVRHWSSSLHASDVDIAWVVYFGSGSVRMELIDNGAFVRAVRSINPTTTGHTNA